MACKQPLCNCRSDRVSLFALNLNAKKDFE